MEGILVVEEKEEYERELNSKFLKLMRNNALALENYRRATESFGLDHVHGLMAALVATVNHNNDLVRSQINGGSRVAADYF